MSRTPPHRTNFKNTSVGVIGFGAIGAAVARVFAKMSGGNLGPRSVRVFDEDRTALANAVLSGYGTASSVKELVRDCDLIVGCTGSPSGVDVDPEDVVGEVIFASASSNNHEFAQLFIKEQPLHTLRTVMNPEVTRYRPASAFDWLHSVYRIPTSRGAAWILNGGFPVNFTGGVDPIAPEEIELTRMLMIAGVATAVGWEQSVKAEGSLELVDLDVRYLGDLLLPRVDLKSHA